MFERIGDRCEITDCGSLQVEGFTDTYSDLQWSGLNWYYILPNLVVFRHNTVGWHTILHPLELARYFEYMDKLAYLRDDRIFLIHKGQIFLLENGIWSYPE